ncbi:N-acetylglutaminylglutamine amidotransferase [bacterium]|nr:N-acetylglutaminylglutamine amidotransferase [bacterium]
MCGIAGILNTHRDNQSQVIERVQRTTDLMKNRGPDAGGKHLGENFILGHRRLKIIDLSDNGKQPMVDRELNLALVFNGAIYNYQQLREQLKQEGYRFFSTSDTEVLIKAYHFWGKDFVKRLNGMFAFCLVEIETGKAILARDRLGIKPLYYSFKGMEMMFASSLTALAKGMDIETTINPQALQYYMTFHSIVPPPDTIFNKIAKLPPATVMTVEPDGAIKEEKYWNLDFYTPEDKAGYTEAEWLAELDTSLKQAVQRRLVADVPVGVLLSGGLDSSLITALVAAEKSDGLETFSIGFESVNGEEGNEFIYSDIIAEAFNTRHHKLMISGSEVLGSLQAAINSMNEPMVSHDNVGFFLISKEVANHVKVVQSGQGADEVFAGYHWYPPMQSTENAVDTYVANFFDRSYKEYRETINSDLMWSDIAKSYVARQFAEVRSKDPVDKALSLDINVMLVDDPVKRVDNQTMGWGLEARVPFLDHELVELAAQIPSKFKLAHDGKGILKTLARKYVPAEVIDRPKGYFPIPALKYLSGSILDYVKDHLTSQKARERGLYNPSYVENLLASPETGLTNLGGSKLWQLGLLEIWLQNHQF